MANSKYQEIGKGVIKRREKKTLGLFIDGIGLDRATRRLKKRVDMSALVRGVSSGTPPTVARYYTIIPHEDDSRHRAFLDAVARAGLKVIVKRLPPKGIERQVSIDVEMAADMVAFALGNENFSDLSEYKSYYDVSDNNASNMNTLGIMPSPKQRFTNEPEKFASPQERIDSETESNNIKNALEAGKSEIVKPENRLITAVCPSRDLNYPIAMIKAMGFGTTTADFGQFSGQDILKSSAKWIDLSDSETIWKP